MKKQLQTIILIFAVSFMPFSIKTATALEQQVDSISNIMQTWNLSPTMTATLSSDSVLIISTTASSEAMPNFNYAGSPWYGLRSNILSATIGDNVTTVAQMAFQGCYNLTSATIPSSVININGKDRSKIVIM